MMKSGNQDFELQILVTGFRHRLPTVLECWESRMMKSGNRDLELDIFDTGFRPRLQWLGAHKKCRYTRSAENGNIDNQTFNKNLARQSSNQTSRI